MAAAAVTTAASATFVLPGDSLPELTALVQNESQNTTSTTTTTTTTTTTITTTSKKKTLRLSSGLTLSPHTPETPILPYRFGQLKINAKKPSAVLSTNVRRYIPTTPDPVLVTLLRSTNEAFIVQLTPFTTPATLLYKAYATSATTTAEVRKTRPNLQPGALIYCRVNLVHKYLESVELDVPWGGGGGGGGGDGGAWGEVKKGNVVDVGMRMVKVLEDEEGEGKVLLGEVAGKVGFEMVVGRNGRVWVEADGGVESCWKVGMCFKLFDEGEMWRGGEEGRCREMVKRVFGR